MKNILVFVFFIVFISNTKTFASVNIGFESMSISYFRGKPYSYRIDIQLLENKWITIAGVNNSFTIVDYVDCINFWSQTVAFHNQKLRLDASSFIIAVDSQHILLFDNNYDSMFIFESCCGVKQEILPDVVYKVEYRYEFYKPSYIYCFDSRKINQINNRIGFINCYFVDEPQDTGLKRKIVGFNTPLSEYLSGCKKLLAYLFKENAKQIDLIK